MNNTEQRSWTRKPEAHSAFRLAQLLLVFLAIKDHHPLGVTLERLTYYEFFASHPFLVFSSNDAEWRELVTLGRELATVAYASSPHRFVTTRQRLRHDLAGLLGRGLVQVRNVEGRLLVSITNRGEESALSIRSLYAQALERSANLVIRKLRKLSDTKLVEDSRSWMQTHPILIEL